MIDKFLQFTSEAEALLILASHDMSPIIQSGNDVISRVRSGKDGRGAWVIEVGVVVIEEYGTFDDDNNELTPMVMVSGYHVNVRLDGFDIDFGSYDVSPTTPQRVFA